MKVIKSIYYRFFRWYIILFSKSLKDIEGLSRIIIIAPHPDDEILGLGGLILYSLEKNTEVHIIYLTDGEASGIWPDKEEIKKQRIELSEKVCRKMGINDSRIHRLHIPDGKVPYRDHAIFKEVADLIKMLIDTIGPDAVFAPHYLEYWPYDHVAASEIAFDAISRSKTKTQLWYYWVWTWFNLRPVQLLKAPLTNLRKVRIKDFVDRKIELKDIYMNLLTPEGKSWSGLLPDPLMKAVNLPFEVIERII